MSRPRVGIVTGANKGIGLAIVRQLALQYPSSPLNAPFPTPLIIYLTARSSSRGSAALQALQKDEELRRARALKSDGGLAEIKFYELDVADEGSREGFAEMLKREHGVGGVDFLINNAGIALDGFDSQIVQRTLHTNYHSTIALSHLVLPLLNPSPTSHLTTVASTSGSLSKYSPSVRDRFLSATTESDITAILSDFSTAVEQGRERDAGFPSAAYAVSKAGVIGWTRVVAKGVQKEYGGVKVSCCCPGYVNTDMTKGNGTKTVDEGAQTPVGLALGKLVGEVGGFWRDGKEVEW